MLKEFNEEAKDYGIYSIPKLLMVSPDQPDEDMKDLIHENNEILKTCFQIMEDNKKLNLYEGYELIDYLKED